MKIHELSKQSGIHLETIRYYEKMGLMPEPKRLANGYRDYDEASLKQLKFIKTCRALDFSLAEIKYFNALKTQQSQHCEMDSMLAKHLVSVEEKIAELTEIKHFLQSLITEDDHQAADCKAMAQLKAYQVRSKKDQKSARGCADWSLFRIIRKGIVSEYRYKGCKIQHKHDGN